MLRHSRVYVERKNHPVSSASVSLSFLPGSFILSVRRSRIMMRSSALEARQSMTWSSHVKAEVGVVGLRPMLVESCESSGLG